MHRSDLIERAVAAFIDLLIIIGLARLPDVIGFLAAIGYLLFRDGLFDQQSVGKKLIGLRVASSDAPAAALSFRGSIIRNVPLTAAYLLFLVPYAGWVLGPLALAIEGLTALGDDRGMRVGDIIARTVVVRVAPAAGGPPQGPESGPADSEGPPEAAS